MKRPATVCVMVAVAAAAGGQGVRDLPLLTPEQRTAVEQGKTVQILEPVETSPWPRSVVFQFIRATPIECAAVLSDYALQSSYIPRMRSSRIVARHGVNETDVEYVIDIPVFADEKSVSRQRVRSTGSGYTIEWHTVVSDSQAPGSITTGAATFIDMTGGRPEQSGTLMVHDQMVVPSSVFAKIPYVRNKGIESSQAAALAIAHQVEQERKHKPELLARQMAHLRAALALAADSGKVIPGPRMER
jgi:hypothetical protein